MVKKSFAAAFCIAAALFCVFVFSRQADAAVIPITKFRSAELKNGAPSGWTLEKKSGNPSLRMDKEGDRYYLRLMSQGNSSFGVRIGAKVNIKDFPVISWRWRADKIPAGGDVRKSSTDDQALQLYVAFTETGFPAALNTPVIGYIWDCEAPKGWSGRSSQIGGDKLRYIVLRNKTDKTGQWYTEHRNIYEDYKMLFRDINGGEPLGTTVGVQVHINTQRTKTPAESLIGDIYLSSEPDDIAIVQVGREKIAGRTPVITAAPRTPTPPAGRTGKSAVKSGCLNISIEFDTDSAQVQAIPSKSMEAIMEYRIRYPQAKLTITGHTDHFGSDAYNLDLSRKRAESVKAYLMGEYNIDDERLATIGAGKSQPVADNSTLEGQARNRRVMIQSCPEQSR